MVPESPRWLLCKGRVAEVKKILESTAKFNGTVLPANIDQILIPPQQTDAEKHFIHLFRSKYLRRITICFLCIWFTMNLVYYGLILNMSTFGGNIYLNSVSYFLESLRSFCINLVLEHLI